MRIRYKILLILSLITIVLMSSLYAVASFVMVDSISASEKTCSSADAERFVTNLNCVISSLDNSVNDWAKWDDTYYFMENGNSDYIKSNMLDDSFDNLQLNMILCFDTSKQLTYGKMYDLTNQTERPLNQEIVQDVADNENLFSDPVGTPQGLILVDGMPMLVASHSILNSLLEGPSHGTMVMGRFLDKEELVALSILTGLPLSISTLSSVNGQSELSNALQHISPQRPIYANSLNETAMAGYVLLEDIQGNPIAVAQVLDNRAQLAQGKTALTYISLALTIIGIITFLVVALLIDKIVLSKLSLLNETVTGIRKTGDNSKRIKTNGKDELSSLSENINNMLDVIDKHTRSLEMTVQEHTKDLFENQEKLRTILLASPDAIVATDLEGKITECNSQMCELSLLERDQLIGKSALDLLIDKRSEERLVNLYNYLSAGQGIKRYEIGLVKGDSTQYPAELSINTIRNAQGSPTGFVAIVRDLSERKMLEQRLFNSERLAAIGELAGMVGHDIRNPLTAIKNAAYVLKKKCNGCSEAHAPEMFDAIDKAVGHSNKIVNDLLEYSREVRIEPIQCSVKQLLAEAVSMVKIPRDITLLDNTTDIKLMVDESKMVRVFINLIRNSLDAMSDGGILQVSDTFENGYVSINFTDTGIGIPKDAIPKLFTPLYTTKAQGMGFGLSISKRIIEAHAGKITVQSEVGKGTAITLTFPRNAQLNGSQKNDWIIEQDIAVKKAF